MYRLKKFNFADYTVANLVVAVCVAIVELLICYIFWGIANKKAPFEESNETEIQTDRDAENEVIVEEFDYYAELQMRLWQ